MVFQPGSLRQGPSRAQHQVIGLRFQRRAFRAFNGKGQDFPRTGADRIAHAGKDNQTIQQMIAIRTTPRDMEKKIDLGRGRFRDFQRRVSAAGWGARPFAILASIFGPSSPSGPSIRARRH